MRVRVLAAGRRPRRVAGWLEDIEIVLTPNLYSFQLQVVFVMLLCEPWQPCVRARSRKQQGGGRRPGVCGRWHRNRGGGQRLLAVPPCSAAGARRTPWPARPKASGYPPSPYAHAGNGGVGNASAGIGSGSWWPVSYACSAVRRFRERERREGKSRFCPRNC